MGIKTLFILYIDADGQLTLSVTKIDITATPKTSYMSTICFQPIVGM